MSTDNQVTNVRVQNGQGETVATAATGDFWYVMPILMPMFTALSAQVLQPMETGVLYVLSWDGGGSVKGFLFPPAGGQLVFKLQLPAVEAPAAAPQAKAVAAATSSQPDFTNVRILMLKTGELRATADSADMGGIIPIIFYFTSPATLSGKLILNAPYTFSGTYRDGSQQQFNVLYNGEQSNGGLTFVI